MPSITKARLAALETIERTYNAQGAQLIAALEVAAVRHAADLAEIEELRTKLAEAQSEAHLTAATHSDAKRIVDRAALLRRAKQLSAEGVPCTMRGDFILHAKTKAILAQVAR